MKKVGIPIKGVKEKAGKIKVVKAYDASAQRRISSSKKVRVGRPKP